MQVFTPLPCQGLALWNCTNIRSATQWHQKAISSTAQWRAESQLLHPNCTLHKLGCAAPMRWEWRLAGFVCSVRRGYLSHTERRCAPLHSTYWSARGLRSTSSPRRLPEPQLLPAPRWSPGPRDRAPHLHWYEELQALPLHPVSLGSGAELKCTMFTPRKNISLDGSFIKARCFSFPPRANIDQWKVFLFFFSPLFSLFIFCFAPLHWNVAR